MGSLSSPCGLIDVVEGAVVEAPQLIAVQKRVGSTLIAWRGFYQAPRMVVSHADTIRLDAQSERR
jgi:hypothetical protein